MSITLIDRIKKTFPSLKIKRELRDLRNAIRLQDTPTIPPAWEGFEHYETDVSLAIKEFLKPGDVFFDVGANLGGITVQASRLVGPRGHVLAFEASPRILPTLFTNIRYWNASNVFILPLAAWEFGGELLPLYFGKDHYADSLFTQNEGAHGSQLVPTITLEEAAAKYELNPQLIKMDIEGAELNALKGSVDYIRNNMPRLILEVTGDSNGVIDWLLSAGYSTYALDTYEKISKPEDIHCLTNIFCYGPNDEEADCYFVNMEAVTVSEFGIADMQKDREGTYFPLGEHPPGRYGLEIKYNEKVQEHSDQVTLSIMANNRIKTLHICPMNFLASNKSALLFDVDYKSPCFYRIKGVSREDIESYVEGLVLKSYRSGA